MADVFKVGDRVWFKDTSVRHGEVLRRAEVIHFDTRWGFAITVRLDGTTGSVTTYPGALAAMSTLDLLAEQV
jgi:hypothetical protein